VVLLIALIPFIVFSQTASPETPVTGTFSADTLPGNAGSDTAVSPETPAAGPGTAASRAQEEALYSFDDAPVGTGNTVPRSPSSAFAIFRMVLVLALVAGVIYVVVFFIRRLGKPQVEQNPHLKILASTHLGNGRYVHVISVGKEAWLIGSGEGGVTHIAGISDKEAVDAMALDASKKNAETPEPLNFKSLVKKFSGGLSAKEQDRLEKMRSRRERFKRY